MSSRILVLGIVTLSIVSRAAHAQEKPNYLLKKKETNARAKKGPCDCAKKEEGPQPPPGPWTFKFRIGSVFQFSNNKSVVGKIDGTSQQFNLDVHGEANFEQGRHNIRNRLDATGVVVKTQNTGRRVPASDFVELESIYQYRSIPLFGPFARAGLNTAMFVGRDFRTNSVRYQLPDGTLTAELTEYRLTDPFVPLTLLQSAGVFYNPVREETFDIDIRTGIGVREIFADDQLGVKDDEMTPSVVELVELNSYVEAGVEFIAMVRGEAFDETVSYYAGGEFLLPVLRTKQPGDNRSSFDLISKIFRVGLAYKLAKRATILYELRLVHQPQLIDVYQVQNNVGFKATFDIL